ncbi:phage shock protein C {PspC} family protein [Geoglobus ahangari]|uniref:Phage shock protein C (PspC) family protein n=1 Tax=Geoglobus ahangari TaxID=113653 RepID=A0A0F7IH18_9EURY|nr:PspC domain-containing protein [Geoglobus ahangari]AKG91993.1 phage shock protein C {PspC} family protein [Geoglobus ahangari]
MEKLFRSRSDRVIAGVCGGLARYFGVDATLIRLIFVVGALLKGVTILIYIILALIIPEEPEDGEEEERPAVEPEGGGETRRKLLAYLLILFGAFVFMEDLFPFWLSDEQIFAAILILIGIWILKGSGRE